MFVQENIEKLKREWTDKYVVVEGNRPELRRFEGYTGQVKTVNMSGRALVQFDAWSNIGWYDIELGFLHIVPKPDPSLAGKKAEVKKEAAPAKGEAAKPAAAKAPAAKPAGGKMSVAEMLAAARANKPAGAAPAAKAEPAVKKEAAKAAVETVAKPQAAKTVTAAPALVKGQRPSIAEMIAYCRTHDTK